MAPPSKGVRIIAGEFRGRKIPVPSGKRVRPTQDRVREALFSTIGPSLPGARFLDAFAGTGANGFEALSRGADFVLLADSDPRQRTAMGDIADEWGLGRRARVLGVQFPACAAAIAAHGPFDFIFADPPYAYEEWEALFETFAYVGLLADDGEIIIEHSSRVELPEAIGGLPRYSSRSYGDSCLTRYR